MEAGRVLPAYSAGRIVMSGVLSWAPPPKTAQHASDNFARSSAQAKYYTVYFLSRSLFLVRLS